MMEKRKIQKEGVWGSGAAAPLFPNLDGRKVNFQMHVPEALP